MQLAARYPEKSTRNFLKQENLKNWAELYENFFSEFLKFFLLFLLGLGPEIEIE